MILFFIYELLSVCNVLQGLKQSYIFTALSI